MALIAYIVLGYIALKSQGSRRGRQLAFFAALFWLAVIVHLAINKHFKPAVHSLKPRRNGIVCNIITRRPHEHPT